MKRALCVAMFVAFLGFAPEAFASQKDRIVIRTNDVDVTTESGARILMRRIVRAADFACGKSLARQYPAARRAFERCHGLVVERALDQIDRPSLRALYERQAR